MTTAEVPATVPPELAVPFLLNADILVERVGAGAAPPDEVEAVRAALAEIPRERWPDLMAEIATLLVTVEPETRGVLEEVRQRGAVRGGELDPATIQMLFDGLWENWHKIALLVFYLRTLGENHVKIKALGLDVRTASIYRDLGSLVKFWSKP